MLCPSYMAPAMNKDDVRILMRSARLLLREKKIRFDAIVFRGISGALFAPILAYHLNKHLIVVRKSIRNSHSSFKVQGEENIKKYIIVDDLIDSGNTVDNIIDEMRKFSKNAVCIGILLYSKTGSRNKLYKDISVLYLEE